MKQKGHNYILHEEQLYLLREMIEEEKATANEVYQKYYSDIDRNLFNAALKADPTAKPGYMGKYSKWILKLIKKGQWKPGDTPETRQALERFAKVGRKLEKNDIQQYKSVSELYDAVQSLEGVKTRSETKSDAEKVYEDGNWTVIVPHTQEAAQLYGSNTRWCTAAKERNMFDYYNNYGPLYIIIAKQDGTKFQFHFQTNQYMNSEDEAIIDFSDLEKHGNTDGLEEFIRKVMPGSVNMSLFRNDRKLENLEAAIFGDDPDTTAEDFDDDTLSWKLTDIIELLVREYNLTDILNKMLEFLPPASVVRTVETLDEELYVVTPAMGDPYEEQEYNVLGQTTNGQFILISDWWFTEINKEDYSEGIMIVANGDKFNYMDTVGNQLIEGNAAYAQPFSDGYGVYRDWATNELCFVDKEGNVTHTHCKYGFMSSFRPGYKYTLITYNAHCNLIDRQGNYLFGKWLMYDKEQGNPYGVYASQYIENNSNTYYEDVFVSYIDGSVMTQEQGERYLPQGVQNNLNESSAANNLYEEMWEDGEVSPDDILSAFKYRETETQDWRPLIKPVQYQNALRQYMQYGDAMRFPEETIDEWLQIVVRNSMKLDSNTSLAGHSEHFPVDAVQDVYEDEYTAWCTENNVEADYEYQTCSAFLESLGFYDWLKLPDGSDAWSDFGLRPIEKILSEYRSDMSAGEKLILVNRCLDVYHCRGDLASAFIEGGSNSLTKASNNELFEQIHKFANQRGRKFILHEEQVEKLQQLLENRESKNINLARKYLMTNFNYQQDRAQRILDDIRHDIPNTRMADCKFLLGVTRMYQNGELATYDDIANINNTIKFIANGHANEYDSDLNGESAKTLIDRFATGIKAEYDQDVERSNNRQFEDKPREYTIVKISDFEDAQEYADYTSWCVTQSQINYEQYTSQSAGIFYFCLKNGFENVPEERGENCPLDEYGLSMIAVSINPDGSCNTITCRWNHSNGGNDNIMSPEELENVINMPFYQTFKPRSKEDLLRNMAGKAEHALAYLNDEVGQWDREALDDELSELFDGVYVFDASDACFDNEAEVNILVTKDEDGKCHLYYPYAIPYPVSEIVKTDGNQYGFMVMCKYQGMYGSNSKTFTYNPEEATLVGPAINNVKEARTFSLGDMYVNAILDTKDKLRIYNVYRNGECIFECDATGMPQWVDRNMFVVPIQDVQYRTGHVTLGDFYSVNRMEIKPYGRFLYHFSVGNILSLIKEDDLEHIYLYDSSIQVPCPLNPVDEYWPNWKKNGWVMKDGMVYDWDYEQNQTYPVEGELKHTEHINPEVNQRPGGGFAQTVPYYSSQNHEIYTTNDKYMLDDFDHPPFYRITRGLNESKSLNESVTVQQFQPKGELHPKFWIDNKLNSRIRLKLLDIADDFIKDLNINWVKPEDIVLTGSIANYNWTKYSDIDVHVIMDYRKVYKKTEFVKSYFDSKKEEWGSQHENLKIYGFPVEMYVEDSNAPTEASGVYSLEKNKWVKEPQDLSDAKINASYIKQEVEKFMDSIDKLESKIKKEKDDKKVEILSNKMVKIFDKLKSLRKSGLKSKSRELSSGNIIWKMLRAEGYIEKIWRVVNYNYDKQMSIRESMQLNEGGSPGFGNVYLNSWLGRFQRVLKSNRITTPQLHDAIQQLGIKQVAPGIYRQTHLLQLLYNPKQLKIKLGFESPESVDRIPQQTTQSVPDYSPIDYTPKASQISNFIGLDDITGLNEGCWGPLPSQDDETGDNRSELTTDILELLAKNIERSKSETTIYHAIGTAISFLNKYHGWYFKDDLEETGLDKQIRDGIKLISKDQQWMDSYEEDCRNDIKTILSKLEDTYEKVVASGAVDSDDYEKEDDPHDERLFLKESTGYTAIYYRGCSLGEASGEYSRPQLWLTDSYDYAKMYADEENEDGVVIEYTIDKNLLSPISYMQLDELFEDNWDDMEEFNPEQIQQILDAGYNCYFMNYLSSGAEGLVLFENSPIVSKRIIENQ